MCRRSANRLILERGVDLRDVQITTQQSSGPVIIINPGDRGDAMSAIMESGTPAYFSSSDGAIESVLRRRAIETSLVFNLLFEPAGLLIPDIFFFNNDFFTDHLSQGSYPLLLRAVRDGLVTPAFRNPEIATFSEALRVVQSGNIVGSYARETSDGRLTQQELAEMLDRAWLGGERKTPRFWPDNLGEAFDREATTTLLRRSVPFADEQQLEDWEATQELRAALLEMARKRSARLGGERAGLRRGELFNALGLHFGVLDDDAFVTPHELFRATLSMRDRLAARRMKLLANVVNVSYHRSQSAQFRVWHNLPSALSDVGRPLYSATDPTTPALEPAFDHVTSVPSLESLGSADTGDIINARRSDAGLWYFEARSAWIAHRSTRNLDALREATDKYAAQLRSITRRKQRQVTMRVLIAGAPALLGGLGMASLELGVSKQVFSAESFFITQVGGALAAALITYRGSERLKLSKVRVHIDPDSNIAARNLEMNIFATS
jgi:hypothetical protein